MEDLSLFMVIIGCTPPGRFTEQHDVFFGIGSSMKALIPDMIKFWPEAKGRLHVDAWRKVSQVDGYTINIVQTGEQPETPARLFFLNLGGYKPGEFEEYHYKMLAVAETPGAATQQARKTAFYKHNGFKGAESHVDDKYGVDVDEIYKIDEILGAQYKEKYAIKLSAEKEQGPEDVLHIGYYKLDKL